ncbi:MAG TPA: alpha-L-fucosidase [Candidatus Limnocylindrales bacterium]|nr:alpha-L-fucosidase [Candidatus Limnocylindrales bacterium]
MKSKPTLLFLSVLPLIAFAAESPQTSASLPIAPGPFQPTMESLTQYHCPDWFRDAKFGIWAHWGPQAVPMDGDWYARQLYQQGHAQYKDHLEHYGHPSTNGYKDIIPLWKAEKWDPDRLMDLYKRAGARYFVSMGSHHDNFFLWNSKLHKWNAVNMGPKRDVVGEWQKAARKHGMHFGVSEHLGASFTWFQDSHKSDKTGPLAGVPYDGANPQYEDLYHFPAEPGDTGWYSTNPRWQHMWFDEIKELVDNYHPDLLYTDGGVPFGNEVGRSLIAHLYNSDAQRHRGGPQVVYTCKQKSEGRWVEDLERGVMPGINPNPWQTDTSIGDWFYNRNWKFRPVSWTIHMLVDIVSKNGNLLLNVVQRPDGSLNPEVEQLLHEMADWIALNGEAIYGTRPWEVYGEGPVRTKGGHFKEDFNYTAKDIRFTTKGKMLYAVALGWPEDGQLLVRSLGKSDSAPGSKVTKVSLLGYKGSVEWRQTPDGLSVKLPAQKLSPYTSALKITGTDLKPVPLKDESAVIQQDHEGNLLLGAASADIHGDQVNTEERDGQTNLGFWDKPADWVSWKVRVQKPGKFAVSASIATINEGAEVALEAGQGKVTGPIPRTGDWGTFQVADLGQIYISEQGEQTIKLRPKDAATWKPINLRFIRLTRSD